MKTPWRMWYEFRNRNWWQVDLVMWAILIAMAILMSGCGGTERPLSDAPAGAAGATLGQLGSTLTWIGGICAAAGIALRVISLVYPPLAGLGAIFGFLAIGGASVTATGASIQWLADNPIVMVAAILSSTGAVVFWYWPRLRRAWDRRMDGKV